MEIAEIPKISIIIPIYNASKYIKRCLNSLIKQTYGDFEIICVNDGSKDNSLEILKKYSKKDNRIKIINQENQGPASARQNGLNSAIGEYVWFFDADDDCNKNSIEILVNNIKNNPADIIYFGTKLIQKNWKIFSNDKKKRIADKNYYELKKATSIGFDKYLNIKDDTFILFSLPRELWNKIYNRDFLISNNIEFCTSISLYDDILFTTKCLLFANKIKLINNFLYNYHLNIKNSVMQTANKRIDGVFYYFNYMYNFLKDNDFDLDIRKNWLSREICKMNYWLTRKNINKDYYLECLKNVYLKIKDDIIELSINNAWAIKNKNIALNIINNKNLEEIIELLNS